MKATLTGPSLSFTIHSPGVLVELDGAPITPPPSGPDAPLPPDATGYDLNTSAALLEAFNNKLDPLGTPDMARLGSFGQPGTWNVTEAGFTRSNSCYRWTAALVAPADGEYTFTLWCKSGGSIWFDGELVWALDREEDALSTATGHTEEFTRTLVKGKLYPLKAHCAYQGLYYGLTLDWKRPDRDKAESVATAFLHPPADWQTRVKDYVPPPPEPLPYVVPDAGYRSPELAKLFPDSSPWNTPIDQAEVDPLSEAIIARLGDLHLHPVFGPGVGIPFEVVPDDVPKVTVTFDYAGESDPGPYPIPAKPVLESGGGDGHWLGVQGDWLYELFLVRKQGGQWYAGSGAIFDLTTGERVPGWKPGWTSADAAGLPILPGLLRYDEFAKGEINHAIRISLPFTRRAFTSPASHWASTKTDEDCAPMGSRFRLRSNFDESQFPPSIRPIAVALKRYGTITADNGSSFIGLCGCPHSEWRDDELAALKTIKASDFVVVKMGEVVTKVE